MALRLTFLAARQKNAPQYQFTSLCADCEKPREKPAGDGVQRIG